PVRKGRDTLAGLFASGMALASDVEVNVLAAFPSGNCRALDHDRSDQSREGGEGRGQRRAIGTPQRSARHLREAGAAAKFLRTGSAICAVHESGFGPMTSASALPMSAFDAVDGASSAASKWYRMIASKPERFKEVMPGNEMAFEVFKELARTRRRNADTVDPGIGRTRLGQRTLKCVFLIGTRSAHSIRASGLTAAQTGRTHDRTRPMLQQRQQALAQATPTHDPKRTWRGHWNLRKIEHRREPPEGDMQRRWKRTIGQRAAHDQAKGSQSADQILSSADFPVFIVIDDKGNDFFKDLNRG